MGATDALQRRVGDARLDVGFLELPDDAVVTGVRSHVLARDRHVAVVAPGHRLAKVKRLRLARLAEEPFVDFPPGTSGRLQTDEAFDAARLARDVAFEVTDVHLMAGLIREGLGVGLLPSAFASPLAGVVTVPVAGAPARAEHLIWSSFGPSPAAAAFLNQLGVAR